MKSFFLAAATALALAAPATAATLRLDAQTTNANVFTSFWLTFNDLDNDRRFGNGELLTFSGTVYVPFQAFPVGQLTSILVIPTIPGIADGGQQNWQFFGTGAIGSGVSQWTYAISDLPTAVPLPATGVLLAGALAALFRGRRRT